MLSVVVNPHADVQCALVMYVFAWLSYCLSERIGSSEMFVRIKRTDFGRGDFLQPKP